MNVLNKLLSSISPKDKIKIKSLETNANNYSLPKASSSTLGGVIIGSNITLENNKPMITKTSVLNILNTLTSESNSTINNIYLSKNDILGMPKKVTQRSMINTDMSSWSIPNLVIGAPLFILHEGRTVNSHASIYVQSGGNGGTTSYSGIYYKIGCAFDSGNSSIGNTTLSNIFITIPTATTVVLKCSGSGDDEILYAFQ